MAIDVKKSMAALALAAAIGGGGLIEGTKEVKPIDTAAPMEIVAERTETAKVFDAGLDTLITIGAKGKAKAVVRQKRVAVVSSTPVHWKDVDGNYKAIDTTVQARALITAVLSKYEYETAFTGETSALFDKDSDADYAVTRGGRSIEYTLLSDTTGVDVTTETTTRGVKQTYTLRDAKAATELRWLIDTDAEMTREGDGFVFRDDEGKFLWRIAPPKAWDAGGKTLPVTVTAQGDTLTWAVDVAGAEYPVTVDPTTVIDDTDATTGLVDGYYNANYLTARGYSVGAEWNENVVNIGIIAQYYSGAWRFLYRRAMFTFDTSGLPDNADVLSASVRMDATEYLSENGVAEAYLIQPTFSGAPDTTWFNDFTGWASGSGAYSSIVALSDSQTIATTDSLNFNLNAAGLAAVNVTGDSKFFGILDKDLWAKNPGNYNFIISLDDNPYMLITYAVSTVNAPTLFSLTAPTTADSTTQLHAWVTPNHSADIDSMTVIKSDSTWVAKFANPLDTQKLITGLTPGTEYRLMAHADSADQYACSNLDTLWTRPNTAAGLALTSVDHDGMSVNWTANSNGDSTLYAIQVYNVTDDSTYYWTGAALAASATWKTRTAWGLPEAIAGLTVDTNYRIGIQAKNGDGVTAAYTYIFARTAEFTQSQTVAINTMFAHRAGIVTSGLPYVSARGSTEADSITTTTASSTSARLGQRELDTYEVDRISIAAYIPNMDFDTFKLHLIGTSDASTDDFAITGRKGTFSAGGAAYLRFYTFEGWVAGLTGYGGDELFTGYNTSGWNASGDNVITFNSAGLADAMAAKGDTLRVVLLSSKDIAADDPTAETAEYVTVNTGTSYFTGEYEYTEAAAYNVNSTDVSPTSVIVTWADSTLTEYGFALVDSATGVALSDTTLANAEADTLSGLIPNTIYRIRVKIIGGNKDGTLSTTYTLCTLPGTPGTPVITDLGDGLVKVVIDTTGAKNPGDTEYSLMFITSAGDSLWEDADSLKTTTLDENSAWGWETYANRGAANGDTIQAEAGRNYTIKAIARTRAY